MAGTSAGAKKGWSNRKKGQKVTTKGAKQYRKSNAAKISRKAQKEGDAASKAYSNWYLNG